LYPGVPPGCWMPAREMNELACAARLGWSGCQEKLVRGRMLDPRHFEFRGGSVRPASGQMRTMDTEKVKRDATWWAAGISMEGPARQARLRREHAARYPLIPPGLWLPAKAVADLLAGPPRKLYHQPADRRTLDPAHFQFRGGVHMGRADNTRATDQEAREPRSE